MMIMITDEIQMFHLSLFSHMFTSIHFMLLKPLQLFTVIVKGSSLAMAL